MNDQQLDKLIETAAARFRAPPEPPLGAMWEGISERRRLARPRSRAATWWRISGIAAAVVLSFTLGRFSASRSDVESPAVTASSSVAAGEQPVAAAASQLLGQTVVLLSALPAEEDAGVRDQRLFADQAGELLVTTRLLIDSRVAARDPSLKSLLEDLELVLAQLARLRNGESRAELELITDALQQQDIVPRIRSAAAGLSAGAD